jgi:hypothetical protein
MITEFKCGDSQLTAEDPHLTKGRMTDSCPACGRVECECPRPLGECCECRVPIFEADAWMVDSDGGHYCLKCWPGGEA